VSHGKRHHAYIRQKLEADLTPKICGLKAKFQLKRLRRATFILLKDAEQLWLCHLAGQANLLFYRVQMRAKRFWPSHFRLRSRRQLPILRRRLSQPAKARCMSTEQIKLVHRRRIV
jgi:hypothetical protein